MDLSFRPTWISPSVIQARGYSLEELAELPLDRHLTPESLACMRALTAVHLTPERLADPTCAISVAAELELYRKDGSTMWADSVITLVRDRDGQPTMLLGVGRDITDRKRVEEPVR
jgi:PAS domain S-box-containing protein